MKLNLRYDKPAENSDRGWEEYSIPVGNGYMGVNIFGGIECERLQITENSMVNPGEGEPTSADIGGLTDFAEIYIKFPHKNVTDYERGLCLNNGVAYTRYTADGVAFKREYFASYPDKVFVCRLEASTSKALEFELCPQIPFIKDYAITEGDNGGKTGTVSVDGDTVTLSGKMNYYNILFEGQVRVITDGTVEPNDNSVSVSGATEAVIITAVGTNYKLCKEVFATNDRFKKTLGENPHEKVSEYISSASEKKYNELFENHTNDFSSYFDRVMLDLGESDSGKTTDRLLEEYKNGNRSKYLEALYFQYGRYLLISSSRKGCLPANLQGIWNCHEHAPWGSGYWHNINVQMNYWPAFNTNLVEMFEPYADYFEAFYASAEKFAEEYIKRTNPENHKEGECGWTIGTAAYPYYITAPGKHSGPGTGALTSKLFWEYYDFTRDKEILKNVSYKALKGMSDFLTKTVKQYDGEYLTSFSASPEQMHNGPYIVNGTYYHTVGCAFDAQLMYENGKDFIKASDILDEENESLAVQREQIDKYHPVRIGWSGQVKEFLEERFYGEIGEYKHRHISQLMALYPGTVINSDTDAWLDAAKYTLTERGDESTGWALAHRLNAWARTGDGDHAYKLVHELIANKTNPNLWDEHPPFQIDGNFGATSGIAEMLVQSHEGYIHILPSLPSWWDCGEVNGLTARGCFEVGVKWSDGCAERVVIKSKLGGKVRIKANFASNIAVSENGKTISTTRDGSVIEFDTHKDGLYEIVGYEKKTRGAELKDFTVSKSLELNWTGGKCNILRAADDDAVYTCIAKDVLPPFRDDFDFNSAELVTYKLVSDGGMAIARINHSTDLERDIYENVVKSRL